MNRLMLVGVLVVLVVATVVLGSVRGAEAVPYNCPALWKYLGICG